MACPARLVPAAASSECVPAAAGATRRIVATARLSGVRGFGAGGRRPAARRHLAGEQQAAVPPGVDPGRLGTGHPARLARRQRGGRTRRPVVGRADLRSPTPGSGRRRHGEDRGPGPAPQLRTILGSRGSRRLHPVSRRQGQVHRAPRSGIGRLPHPFQRGPGPGLADLPMAGLPATRSAPASAPAQRAGAVRVGRSVPVAGGEDVDAGRQRAVAGGLGTAHRLSIRGLAVRRRRLDLRGAHSGARNFHDSNRVLFGRERGFRSLL